jgi:hypothetical protein
MHPGGRPLPIRIGVLRRDADCADLFDSDLAAVADAPLWGSLLPDRVPWSLMSGLNSFDDAGEKSEKT